MLDAFLRACRHATFLYLDIRHGGLVLFSQFALCRVRLGDAARTKNGICSQVPFDSLRRSYHWLLYVTGWQVCTLLLRRMLVQTET